MGMFSENYSGNRCSDCTWADNMEAKLKEPNPAIKIIKDKIGRAADLLDKYYEGNCKASVLLFKATRLLRDIENEQALKEITLSTYYI